ncbi:MAG: DinB family protein [Gemmatimonadales bacterium]
MTCEFLTESYATERLKTLTVWSLFTDHDLAHRPTPLSRSVREQMVHQCLSEDGWFSKMLGLDLGWPPLPASETRVAFLTHYGEASGRRLASLTQQPDSWFEEVTAFFDVPRSRAWVLLRRIAHSAHHRGQLTVSLRLLGRPLYSTYGPTADTGGLAPSGGRVIYRYDSVEALLAAEAEGGTWPSLPPRGEAPVTERPDGS